MDLKKDGVWRGSIYQINEDTWAFKVTGFEAVWLNHDEMLKLLMKEKLIEKKMRDSGR